MKEQAKPEEFDLSQWTVNQLKELKPDQLHRFSEHVFGTLAAVRILLGRCLLAVEATGLYAEHGYSDAIHYALGHGIPEREALDARRLARYLEDLPKLARAAEKGELVWSALRAIAPKASPDTEERWLELAEQTPVHILEKIAARTGKGQSPGKPDPEAAGQPSEVVLTFRVSAEVATLFAHATRDLSVELGQALDANQTFELVTINYHTGAHHADDEAVKKVLAGAAADLKARADAERREVETALGTQSPEGEVSDRPSTESEPIGAAGTDTAESADSTTTASANEMPEEGVISSSAENSDADSTSKRGWQDPEPPTWGHSVVREPELSGWAATECRLTANPGQSDLSLVSRVRFNPQARTVTPAQRKLLLRRDGYRCCTPGCPPEGSRPGAISGSTFTTWCSSARTDPQSR